MEIPNVCCPPSPWHPRVFYADTERKPPSLNIVIVPIGEFLFVGFPILSMSIIVRYPTLYIAYFSPAVPSRCVWSMLVFVPFCPLKLPTGKGFKISRWKAFGRGWGDAREKSDDVLGSLNVYTKGPPAVEGVRSTQHTAHQTKGIPTSETKSVYTNMYVLY